MTDYGCPRNVLHYRRPITDVPCDIELSLGRSRDVSNDLVLYCYAIVLLGTVSMKITKKVHCIKSVESHYTGL